VRGYFAPGSFFAFSVLCSLALAVALVWLATAQPWLGIGLAPQGAGVVVAQIHPQSPLPQELRGAALHSIAAPGAPALELTPRDLIEEPDVLDAAAQRDFYARQAQIFGALAAGPVTLTFTPGARAVTPQAAPKRPLDDLPAKFWMQLGVALTGLLIGAWVVCLRPREGAAWMVALAGLGLALASGTAALYSARELALAAGLFSTASRINSIGTMTFGIGMLTLFLFYPRRIVPRAMLGLPALLIGGWLVVFLLHDWPRHGGQLHAVVAAIMAALALAIGAQVIVNRRDPTARAILGWLGLSVMVGAGGFVLTAIVPFVLDQEGWLAQSTAFLFFLLIYAGIAMAVLRYRLFDLASWSFGILFYGIGVALLLGLDAALIYGLSLDRAPAFGIALASVGLIYLPLRERVARWLRRKRSLPAEELYRRVTEIAHAIDPAQQQALLRTFWSDLFHPLSITALPDPRAETALIGHGGALQLGPVLGQPALRLDWAGQGARLFSSADLARARAINQIIDGSLRQNRTYLEAITTERSRINRDMHDNIGVLLLSALHAIGAERKDLLIRQTLTDLREIISNPDQSNWNLGQLMADLRAEIIGHLEAADVAVRWEAGDLPEVWLAPQIVHTLRSFLREGTSNIVRHSGARAAVIHVAAAGARLSVSLSDNGHGFDTRQVQLGNGFRNLAARVSQLGGDFAVSSTAEGTRLSTSLPLGMAVERAAE